MLCTQKRAIRQILLPSCFACFLNSLLLPHLSPCNIDRLYRLFYRRYCDLQYLYRNVNRIYTAGSFTETFIVHTVYCNVNRTGIIEYTTVMVVFFFRRACLHYYIIYSATVIVDTTVMLIFTATFNPFTAKIEYLTKMITSII